MAARRFVHESLPCRVVFGAGCLSELPAEIDRLGVKRALVMTTSRARADEVLRLLGGSAAGVYDRAVLHVPVDTVREARDKALGLDADVLVAIGGGSSIGLAKAVALDSGLPILAIPTTFSGSEVTPIWGKTDGGVKRTGRDARALPRTVIYDPVLTLSLPPSVAGPSGMNAIAHCVEALYARDASPVISLMAEEGIRVLAASLPTVVSKLGDIDASASALQGAWLAGTCLGSVGMALHHKLCHTLGGAFNLPHAETHAIILPHVAAYNAHAAPDAMRRVAEALGDGSNAAAGLYDLARRIDAPKALKDIGLKAGDLDRAAELATRNPYDNPRPVTREGVRALLDAAFHGHRPVG